LQDQLNKAAIKNPINGTVLTKYAEAGEMTNTGKAIYKIADLSFITLRAYISGSQLPQVKLGQTVKVLVDDGKNKYREMPGTITWISGKAEFTPKTIQTKEERANLVYAIKIKVKNDGSLKIGMYAEVKFN
jgi:HlyD family secretion protein